MEKCEITFTLLMPKDLYLDSMQVLFVDYKGNGYEAEIESYTINNLIKKGVLMNEKIYLCYVTITMLFKVTPPELNQGNYFLSQENNVLHPMNIFSIHYYGKKRITQRNT